MSQKIAVAMSGGVDSSVVVLLLTEMGYEVAGLTLNLLDEAENGELKSLSEQLMIAHSFVDARREFYEKVVEPFASEYMAGRTPNPCIECNRHIKFGLLLDKALELGCGRIATGHYVISEFDGESGRWLIRTAKDATKDQSYVLYTLSQKQLSHALFPLGGLHKQEVKKIALENGLSCAGKPESQDICFVPDGDYSGYIETRLGIKSPPGAFLDSDGNEIGPHKGLTHYTIGQRRGLGISSDRRIFVIDKDAASNTVTVGDEELLFAKRMTVSDVNWVSTAGVNEPVKALVKSRYRQAAQPATLHPVSQNRVIVEFNTPQRALTPGQSAVFYDGDVVLGGGKICRGDEF